MAQAEQEAVTYGIYIVSERKNKKQKNQELGGRSGTPRTGAWDKLGHEFIKEKQCHLVFL